MAGNAQQHWSENVRFLLWEQGVDRQDWLPTAASWFGCPRERAREILDNRRGPGSAEAQLFFAKTGQDDQSFPYLRLVASDPYRILRENVTYLADGLEHGRKKELCAVLEIDRSTLSRWKAGRSRPSRPNQLRLLSFFGLPAVTDLQKEPLFLSLDPWSPSERRRLLRHWIDTMDDRTLHDLYPSLKRLMGG